MLTHTQGEVSIILCYHHTGFSTRKYPKYTQFNDYILINPPLGLDAPKFIMQVAMSCLCVYAFRLCSFEFEPQQLKNELKRKSNGKIASRLHYTD